MSIFWIPIKSTHNLWVFFTVVIFDIPADRLVDLSDADLRELVAHLCEAERERQGGHRNDVQWGGSQTAPDGGLDVYVASTGPFNPTGPLGRAIVGIQVKAGDLSQKAVSREMRPKGSLRSSISALAAQGGAYLIASAGVNCSKEMLEDRESAMSEAVADDPQGGSLHLAFLDRNAISRWVSAHPSVVAWLRPRLSLPTLEGWQPFGRWSSTPAGVADDLICEAGLSFRIERREPIRNLPDALDAIRTLLREGKGAVRVAGLSGIGKSRIVQALFEPVGDVAALPASHAIYTDLGRSPNPAPMGMLEALIERDAPVVLVVDNCPPETHQALTRKLAEKIGPVRLITIEYDVRLDRSEETDVVRIEAKGSDIVEALLRRRYGELAAGDAQRLAELSQGNARLAFALAEAAPHTGTLSTFEDATLFDRLFWQRGIRNDELVRAAEALSLVYSFDFDGEEEPDELTFLGSLAELSRGAMHRHALSLLERGLAQARNRWRAVLPHALANRLARQALRSISWRAIADEFRGNPRLRRSLARRLSYLHDSDEAGLIVSRWMEPGGPLSGPVPDMAVLEAVCHLAPDNALRVVDNILTALQTAPEGFHHLDAVTRMIARIAHSKVTFPQACDRMVALSMTSENQRLSNAEDALGGLFGLYLSGTIATTATRIEVARRYLWALDAKHRLYGLVMLRSALRTGHWSSSMFSFDDARPDAFGWEPKGQEISEWFSEWVDLTSEVALRGPADVRCGARKALAKEIDGLWRCVPALRIRLAELVRQLHAASPWPDGRHALNQMLHLSRRRGEGVPEEEERIILQLIEHMKPRGLEDRVRAELAQGWDMDLEVNDDFRAAETRRRDRLVQLGRELAVDHNTLRLVARDLLTAKEGSFDSFGAGLAHGNDDPTETWALLRDIYLDTPSEIRMVLIFSSFLQALDETAPETAEMIRKECRQTPELRRVYWIFLPAGALPEKEIEYAIEIAGEPETSSWQFGELTWREERDLGDGDRVRLLRAIFLKENGASVVVDSLSMLSPPQGTVLGSWSDGLRELGLNAILCLLSSESINATVMGHMARSLSSCLRGDDGTDAHRVMEAIVDRAGRRYGSTFDIHPLLVALAKSTPEVFLSGVFPDDREGTSLRLRDDTRSCPISQLPLGPLTKWCGDRPDRWERVAQEICPFAKEGQGDDGTRLISPFAVEFLEAAPVPAIVVEAYLTHLHPSGWSGSLAEAMTRRLEAMASLAENPSPEVRQAILRRVPDIQSEIARIRQVEIEEDRARDQSFE